MAVWLFEYDGEVDLSNATTQKRSIGSNEWKIIVPILKQTVQKGENAYTKEIFSLIMQRPRDYANWEWDGVQDLLVELIPLLDVKDIRRLIQDINR